MDSKTLERQVTEETQAQHHRALLWQIKKAEEISPCVEALTSQVFRALPRSPRQLLHGVCLGSSTSFTTSFLSMHCDGKPASPITSLVITEGTREERAYR